jgi:hypothetical protein
MFSFHLPEKREKKIINDPGTVFTRFSTGWSAEKYAHYVVGFFLHKSRECKFWLWNALQLLRTRSLGLIQNLLLWSSSN